MSEPTEIHENGLTRYEDDESAFPKPRRKLLRSLFKMFRPVRHFAPRRDFDSKQVGDNLEFVAQWGEHIQIEDSLIVLHRDGSTSGVRHLVTQLHSRESLANWDEFFRSYDSRTQRLKILQAKLHWIDGTTKNAKQVTHRVAIPNCPPNTHGRTVQLTFSPLRPGMIVNVEEQFEDYHKGDLWPALWGHYFLQTGAPCRYRRHVVAVAKPFELSYRVHHGASLPLEKQLKDYHVCTWEAQDVPGVEFDEWTPPLRDFAPWIDVSTTKSWAPFARLFKTELVPVVNRSHELSNLVNELSEEKATSIEKATAAYTYAARTVRYGRPRSESEVRNARGSNQIFQDLQGDCKDKSALLVQLLRSMNMPAHVAVVLTGDEGRTPFLPSNRFNHAIVRAMIDDKVYWLDAASGEFAFGELPIIDQDLPALVLGDDSFYFEQVPGRLASEHLEYRDNTGVLRRDGSYEGSFHLEFAGELGAQLRSQFIDRTKEHRTKVLQAWLGSDYAGAIGSEFEYEAVGSLSGRAIYKCQVSIDQVARQIKNIVLLQIPWAGKISMWGPMASEHRLHPLGLPTSRLSFERHVIDLPDGVTPFAIPELVSVKCDWGEYRCNWQSQGKQLVCERLLQYGGKLVPSERFAEFKDFLEKRQRRRYDTHRVANRRLNMISSCQPTRQLMVFLFIFLRLAIQNSLGAEMAEIHLRVNQVGYLAEETKIAIAFSEQAIDGGFQVVDAASQQEVYSGALAPSSAKSWGKFKRYYELDFSKVTAGGRYYLQLGKYDEKSTPFAVGPDAYQNYQDDLLKFLRQQRCGYNPLLDMVCHLRDGRTAYGPLPAGSFVDASGGWHDAGDQLKYLITSSNATARLLLAYELDPTKFGDRVDDMGRPLPNGIADVLDEAKWGLDWLHKMHPHAKHLYHQVADDRDHTGWKYPDKDDSDYGWGPNSYRVVYFADGRPQGLAKHKSEATGVANLAGRCAAAMAIAERIWRDDLDDPVFADKCLEAGRELYLLGKSAKGFQQGNSYKAPYRYLERTWADDMEWGAAELFKSTGDKKYLADAERYADIIGATSWLPHDKVGHYEFYPFLNVGHYALYPQTSTVVQKKLADYYRQGIEAAVARGAKNTYRVGAPFVWCSNNLTVALATQILLYEKMTGDLQYHDFMLAQRDWLLGRNPWGTSMFTGIPRDGEYPKDVHTGIWYLTKQMVPGGLVDGPVYTSVYDSLVGLHLTEDDEFAEFQNEHVVYHDDIGDYSTNEPTMDGTADAVTLLAHFGEIDLTAPSLRRSTNSRQAVQGPPQDEAEFTIVEGGIVRGSSKRKELALLFTGGDYGEGTEIILDTLKQRQVPAAFFVTGSYLTQSAHKPLLRRMCAEKHLLGPHSQGHLLYASWDNRNESLVSEKDFKADLEKNIAELRKFEGAQGDPVFFVPPYEWYNKQHVAWAKELGCVLVNFTPGTGSHRDWAPEGDKAFKPSKEILADILAHEARSADGLNGHLLLLHLGSQRQDKMHTHLGELIDELHNRGYKIVRVDQLLGVP